MCSGPRRPIRRNSPRAQALSWHSASRCWEAELLQQTSRLLRRRHCCHWLKTKKAGAPHPFSSSILLLHLIQPILRLLHCVLPCWVLTHQMPCPSILSFALICLVILAMTAIPCCCFTSSSWGFLPAYFSVAEYYTLTPKSTAK